VFDWPKGELVLYGLRNKITRAYLLAGKKSLKVTQSSDKALEHDVARVAVPNKAPSEHASVVVLEIDGAPRVDPALLQQPSGVVELMANQGKIQSSAKEPQLKFDARGVADHWISEADGLSWTFKLITPGTYDLRLVTSEAKYGNGWEGGHKVLIDLDGKKIETTVESHEKRVPPHNPYWPYDITRVQRVTLDKAGTLNVSLKPEKIVGEKKLGLTLVSLELVPVK